MGIQLFPRGASTMSGPVDLLLFFLVGLAGLITAAIFFLIIYFAVKYRRRSPDAVGVQIRGSHKLEAAWTLIPLGLAMVVYFWGARLYIDQAAAPSDALQIYVVAKQWMWKFEHPGGQEEIDELHVPVGRPVKLLMTSQDVIHSFFVPDFRVKQDVLPARYTEVWFEATMPGTFHLFCTQYCGTEHSRMVGSVTAMEPAVYQEWLDLRATQSLASRGAAMFQQLGCISCHRSDSLRRAPVLEGLYGRPVQLKNGQTVVANEAYIRESILHPTAKVVAGYDSIMPSFEGRVNEQQMIQLIAYIRSLGDQAP